MSDKEAIVLYFENKNILLRFNGFKTKQENCLLHALRLFLNHDIEGILDEKNSKNTHRATNVAWNIFTTYLCQKGYQIEAETVMYVVMYVDVSSFNRKPSLFP